VLSISSAVMVDAWIGAGITASAPVVVAQARL
jgi:hypothetical protein